jgi:hypothetical protein
MIERCKGNSKNDKESEQGEQLNATEEPAMNYIDDARINAQFNSINAGISILAQPSQHSQPSQHHRHFNIADRIIDRIDDDKFLIKIGFRELMEYATSITFNRDLDDEQVDKLFTSIKVGYPYPYTMDAIYDKTRPIGEKSIKIINGNHRYIAICKYITEHDKDFSCNYNVYLWISVVDECESTNIQQSINLYTIVNNHLPFKAPIIVDIKVMVLLDKLCKHKFKGKAIMANTRDTSHQPRINKNELYKLLDANKDILENFVSMHSFNRNNLIITDAILEKFIENIVLINHYISLKGFENVYSNNLSADNSAIWNKARDDYGFFLNLKKSNYPKEIWIKYLSNPTDI